MESIRQSANTRGVRILNETRIFIRHDDEHQVRIMRKKYEDGSIVIERRAEKEIPFGAARLRG